MRFAVLRSMVAFFQPYMNNEVRESLVVWVIRIGLVTVALLSAYELIFGE
jgi:hypothetical protein